MSQFCIYLKFDEDYIRQWFIHEHGGKQPVQLLRGSVESKILEVYLTKRPVDSLPEMASDGEIAVAIPTFRNRPPESYNYLPNAARDALVKIIKNRFDIQLWNDLHCFGRILEEQKELIYAFLEKHGIDINDKNWNAVAKRYQRQRNVYLHRERAKKSRNLKKSY